MSWVYATCVHVEFDHYVQYMEGFHVTLEPILNISVLNLHKLASGAVSATNLWMRDFWYYLG